MRNLKISIEDDPWIKSAQITIQKPDTLVVKLMEFQPSFIWNNKSYIDENGNRIAVKKNYVKNLKNHNFLKELLILKKNPSILIFSFIFSFSP